MVTRDVGPFGREINRHTVYPGHAPKDLFHPTDAGRAGHAGNGQVHSIGAAHGQ